MRNSSETKDSWTNTLKLPVHSMRDSPDIKSRQSWLCALTVTSIPIVAITLPREKLSLSFFECGICIAIGEICPLLYKLGYLSSFREDIVKKTEIALSTRYRQLGYAFYSVLSSSYPVRTPAIHLFCELGCHSYKV